MVWNISGLVLSSVVMLVSVSYIRIWLLISRLVSVV